MNIRVKAKIKGRVLPVSEFTVYESKVEIDADAVFAVLHGNLAAYRIRNFVDADICSQIANNFWISPNKLLRYGVGEDGIEAYYLGPSQVEKTAAEYLKEVRDSDHAVKHLFDGTVDPIAKFRHSLLSDCNQYKIFRAATYNGNPAGYCKAIYWNHFGDFLLEPHDDLAQLKDPRQKGFEFEKCTRVMAVNFYAEVPVDAGQLKVWNIEPDNKTRDDLGLTFSGFPYPVELLNDFEHIVIPVEKGDLVLLNGNLIHAVMRGSKINTPKSRLLLTFFMSFNGNNELIWWT